MAQKDKAFERLSTKVDVYALDTDFLLQCLYNWMSGRDLEDFADFVDQELY